MHETAVAPVLLFRRAFAGQGGAVVSLSVLECEGKPFLRLRRAGSAEGDRLPPLPTAVMAQVMALCGRAWLAWGAPEFEAICRAIGFEACRAA